MDALLEELTAEDQELIEAARAVIDTHTDASDVDGNGVHTMGAAVRDAEGRIHVGVNLAHFTGGPCAELVALGTARANGARQIQTIVAVGNHGRGVVGPCGRDRQILFDYHPGIWVLLPTDNGVVVATIEQLMPYGAAWSATTGTQAYDPDRFHSAEDPAGCSTLRRTGASNFSTAGDRGRAQLGRPAPRLLPASAAAAWDGAQMQGVSWLDVRDPESYVRRVMCEEAPSVPIAQLEDKPWEQVNLLATELTVNEDMVAEHDADPIHRRRRDEFCDAILAGQRLPPLIALGASRYLVDGYARLRAVRLLGLAEVSVLVQGRHRLAQHADGVGTSRSVRGAKNRAAVVCMTDGHLLVLRRRKLGRRYAVLPGGGVETGESPRQAALRELHEETGLSGEVLRHLWTLRHPDRTADYFLAAVPDADMVVSGPESERQTAANTYDPVWISVADLDDEDLQPETLRPLIRELASLR